MMTQKWFTLTCKREYLQLSGTLNGGQSFRWKFNDEDKTWIGVFSKHVWILKQFDEHISYQVHGSNKNEDFYNQMLTDYFQLNLNLELYFSQWSAKDHIFKEAANQFYGIRILKQDIVENIFSFICSSNNNITRITGMVEKLAVLYGEKLCEIKGKIYYSFPSVEALAQNQVCDMLKKESFGYRAKYISDTAKLIFKQGGRTWLDELKKLPYEECKIKLMTLSGIGPKVADCICLMSCGHLESVPVDTHVYQIARKFYLPNLPKNKTVTAKMYKEIGDYFRTMYGPLAGWAQTVLFCADLKNLEMKQ